MTLGKVKILLIVNKFVPHTLYRTIARLAITNSETVVKRLLVYQGESLNPLIAL